MGKGEPSLRGEAFRFAAVAIVLRAVWLLVDAKPRFFLGDSESYLATALGVWIPPDRSWLYGLVANAILRVTHQLGSIIALQAALSALACVATALLLRSLGARASVSWAALLLQSLDPLTHYYDRSLLTDAPAASVIWIGLALSAAGLAHTNRWLWIAAVPFLWATLTLRTALLPMVVVPPLAGVGAGLWLALRNPKGPGRFRPLLGPSLQAALVALGLVGYSVMTGHLVKMPPTLNAKQGYFLVGQVAPILIAQDFEGLGVEDPARLLLESNHTEYLLRTWQVFGDTGIMPRLERQFGDWRRTEMVSRVVARRAIRRDPVGFLRLALRCGLEYVTPGVDPVVYSTGFGLDRPLPDGMVASLRTKVRDPVEPDMVAFPSPTLAAIRVWSHALPFVAGLTMVAPLIALIRMRNAVAASWWAVAMIGTTIWAYAGFLSAFSIGLVQRYLLALTPVLVVHLALLMEDGLKRRNGRRAPTTAESRP